MQRGKFLTQYIFFCSILVVAIYLISIFVTNLTGRVWCNHDIYSDAILAKYMWENGTMFPEGWHFGNQIYTVATPAIAALVYGIVKDAYLSLAVASCFMTIGIIVSYFWCLKPFANLKSIIISLMVVLGGTNIGFTAHSDWNGFQVFYTMASYYACYVIGIFLTLGIWLRLFKNVKVHIVVQFCVLLYSFALGMQSLRELLVLNLPLYATVVLDILLHLNSMKENLSKKKACYSFTLFSLVFNICGVVLQKILIFNGVINQTAIINGVTSDIWYNFKRSIRAFMDYIGLNRPTTYLELLDLSSAVFSMVIVVLALLYILFNFKKSKKVAVLEYGIIFFVVSLVAVFCAGLLFIGLRSIYFFCWYFLVAISVVVLMEVKWAKRQMWIDLSKNILIISLIGISVLNYDNTYGQTYRWLSSTNGIYYEIVEHLKADDIKYLYSDWRTEKDKISAMAFDEILYGTLKFSGNPEDLWEEVDYLYHEEWFKPKNFEKAYIVLSDYALYCLQWEFSEEYRTVFMDNLEYVYSFDGEGEQLHFYLGTDKMYEDMIQ